MEDLIPFRTKRFKIGEKRNRLTVTDCGRTESRAYYVICDCDCGSKSLMVRVDDFLSGTTKSCGCYTKDRLYTHGLSGNPVFKRWQAMMARCYKSNHASYKNYGARGISVCEKWHDPKVFVQDMTPGFGPRLQLDRIDTDKDYSPGNCRWVTPMDNLNNKRSSVKIDHDGKSLTARQWADETGLPAKLIRKRIFERGWDVNRALTTPPLSRKESAKVASAKRHALNR